MKKKKNKNTLAGTSKASKKPNKKKWVFLSLGLAATGALSYFGWQYWQTKMSKPGTTPYLPNYNSGTDTSSYTPSAPSYSSTTTPKAADDFPLKKGSKGPKVKALQEVLIAEHGKSILPKYGADGDFGSETLNALKSLKLPEIIDETQFNIIVKGGTVNPEKTAKELYTAVKDKNLAATLRVLSALKSTTDYEIVNAVFKTYNISGVRKTIVNAVLDAFTSENQKQQIRLALAAIGLKYDGEKWSLSGLDEIHLIVTIRPTRVWKDARTSVAVPSKMILGKQVATRGNYTLFENESCYFLVNSQHINQYK